MKVKINAAYSALLIVAMFFHLAVHAQWNGPTSGILNTTNSVLIERPIPGFNPNPSAPPPLHAFETKIGTESAFVIGAYGGIGIGGIPSSNGLELKSRLFSMANSASTEMVRFNPAIGSFEFTTTSLYLPNRGLFLNNPSGNIFTVTSQNLKYNVGANNILDVNTNGITLKGFLQIKSPSDKIEFKVFEDGAMITRELKVNLSDIPPDYVFAKDYKLMSLKEVELFIKAHQHLPNVPSAEEMMTEGNVNILEMQMKLLEKVEELTLYLIDIKKENEELKLRLCQMETQK